MKNFKEYLSESKKKYDFRIKIAGDITNEQAEDMKILLAKFQCSEFKTVGKTPIQELPLDFPKIKNSEVCIYEVSLDYPTTSWELHEYISNGMNLTKDALVVRSPNEPSERYQAVAEKREGALLNDGEYKEAPNAKFEEFYGDKYNTGFVKELNDILKLQRKERGEVIPSEGPAKFNTDIPEDKTSVLKFDQDKRK
jgi:hypothetical protein